MNEVCFIQAVCQKRLLSNRGCPDYYYSEMEIQSLRIIQALVADPNLTRAAERLHLTQSALSKRVHSIEQELGALLFERRGPRGLKPLPQAHELAQLAEKILMAWETGVRRIQNVASEPEHFVLIGPPLFLREVVLPWWIQTQDTYPTLTLEARTTNLSKVSLETIQAGADAGILEHKEELADYVCKPIYTEKWGIVRHPDSRSADLRKYKWGAITGQDNPVETWLVRRQKMPPPSYRIYWQDLTGLAVWVSETPGAASVLPWHSVAWLAKRNKIAFEPLGTDAMTTLYLAYQKSSPHKRFLRALTQLSPPEP